MCVGVGVYVVYTECVTMICLHENYGFVMLCDEKKGSSDMFGNTSLPSYGHGFPLAISTEI